MNRTVETVKKCSGIGSSTWLIGNARQVGVGGLRVRTPYLSTVDLATSMPQGEDLEVQGDA